MQGRTGRSVLAGLVVLVAAAVGPAGSSELEVRAGVVTTIQPVAAAAGAVSASTKRQLGGMLGRALGQAVAGRSGQSYEVTRVAGNIGADLATGEGSGQVASRYLLLVRFDDATESAFTRSGDQVGRLRAGSRVKVVGAGDAATLLPE
ncbi:MULTISPECIES: hypothetical protein [unclassified Luteimonas]|uniref:hypothetical protein n=1 Tax=unclassified Luteimonas TaxID=2629088 RepID=UPI0018F080F8|nr:MULTISPECIES: hypothetical protein [unclassified Luteimonas]MBJ6980312.1 hypothetical protein [Luteimonas sp. MC1895]MBJ6983212.1 hypothetical protein [Luteimonas sp. MC1750]QQO05521.1 hypothetical protein JGR68_11885 [Luteimonas sp. MC1750]